MMMIVITSRTTKIVLLANAGGDGILGTKASRNREDGDHEYEPAHKHCKGPEGVVENRVAVDPGKGAAVVSYA